MSIGLGDMAPDKAEIEACSDAATLARWYRDCVETIKEIKAKIYGYRAAECAELGWLKRTGGKIAALKMAARWVEFRMRVLGLPVPYLPSDPRKEELRRQGEVIQRLHTVLRAAGLDIPA